ncbi:RimK family protein [Magnetofaba australis]|uniref:Putative RimK domain-containing protein ATP-grasp n=1 Tax=Magnetofaba australis IT-1 TaxID=1434232 RepID=A0A1Y2K5D0_9PROT|nr:RimK family protein [Magnetofaba australis]OSM04839.1 putative RimK domain-containing protein ATP-grasp [Magnetofaba australis IT-1]
MAQRYTVVLDQMEDWKWSDHGLELLTVQDYLARGEKPKRRKGAGRVINLCRHYQALSGGYYCSLFAEARKEIALPSMADILDLSHKSLYAFLLPELDEALSGAALDESQTAAKSLTIPVMFGQTELSVFSALGRRLFEVFRYPLMRVSAQRKGDRLRVSGLKPMGLHQVRKSERALFEASLLRFTGLPVRRKPSRNNPLYDLAILYDPKEDLPPSNPAALEAFIKAGQALRMRVELITAKAFHRIPAFDALFIRETTATHHHTFRFARKAEQEGLPVIDDAGSIVRCTNKAFLHELLHAHKIPTPRSEVLDRYRFDEAEAKRLAERLGLPIVLKIPDGSFSRGMIKAQSVSDLLVGAQKLFVHSRLLLAQEFMYTESDWRIGVLGGKPLFASQYMMSPNHWQIYHHREDGGVDEGDFRTLSVDGAPAEVVETARRAAALMGDGLYGVDLKQNQNGVFVIEVNDNPNIDYGVEDKILKGDLYAAVLKEFIRRIEATHG